MDVTWPTARSLAGREQHRQRTFSVRDFHYTQRSSIDNASSASYTNALTGDRHHEPPEDFRGGVLADQMGLGKSLSTIALIACDKDHDRHQTLVSIVPNHVRTTLLVVRAPRKYSKECVQGRAING